MTKPKIKFEKLDKSQRQIILILIRHFLKESGIYKDASKHGINPETTEEELIKLIEDGQFVILYDKEKQVFFFENNF